MQNVAVFTSVTDSYVPQAVMALRSFQRFHPDYGYFILAVKDTISRSSVELIDDYGINLLEIDEHYGFETRGRFEGVWPPFIFLRLKGPELLADLDFDYSLMIDADVFCTQPLELESILPNVKGYAGRPVGSLGRTLWNKQQERSPGVDFTLENTRNILDIDQDTFETRVETNNGVLLWNNDAMAQYRLFEEAVTIFDRYDGHFESDQDLLAFTAAAYNLPFLELESPYHFTFFADSPEESEEHWYPIHIDRGEYKFIYFAEHLDQSKDQWLRFQVDDRDYKGVFIVHFVFCKPWLPRNCSTRTQVHFINAWREFVMNELGERADDYFDDLSAMKYWSLTNIFRCRVPFQVNDIFRHRIPFQYRKLRFEVLEAILTIGRIIIPFRIRDRLWKVLGHRIFD